MYVFDIDELKARDVAGVFKAMDICISRLIYPYDMPEWKEGAHKIKIEKRVHMTKMTDVEAHTFVRSEPDAEGMVVIEYAYDLIALRYVNFLAKKKVAELTGDHVAENVDYDWDFHYKKKEEQK